MLDADGLRPPAAARVNEVYVDPRITSYAVGIVEATRRLGYWGAPDLEPYVSYGASPRGSINLIHGARALALLQAAATCCRPTSPPSPRTSFGTGWS